MSRYYRYQVTHSMLETGIIPVFYHQDAEITKHVVNACYDGGIRAFEFTNRGDFAQEVFSSLSHYVQKELPDMKLGVGSVVEAGTASMYMQLGADFIVSPVLNPDMARACNRRKVLWSPGCGSLSEISQAEELGAEIVKIFPASQVGGPAFIKAVKGPNPWSLIMPTGGVSPDEDNLKGWFEAGAACVGMGSQLFKPEWLAAGDFHHISKAARTAIEVAARYKKH